MPPDSELLADTPPRLYECTVLYATCVSQKEEQDLRNSIDAIFAETGAKQVAVDVWGRRGLAYPIGGVREANVVVYHHEMNPAHVREVDRQVRILPGILRHLLISLPDGHTIIRYSQVFQAWQEERDREIVQARVTKEEQLKQRVIERTAHRTLPEKKIRKVSTPIAKEALTEGIEKIISDADLHL